MTRTDPSSGVDQSQTYDGTHQGAPRRKVSVDRLGRRQVWASPGCIARYGRCQLWAVGLGVAHLKGVARHPESVRWARWCHPSIPTGMEDRGGGDTVKGHGTGMEASGLGTSEQ